MKGFPYENRNTGQDWILEEQAERKEDRAKTQACKYSHKKIRTELAKTRAERDILKKTIGYFAKEPT